MRTRPSAGRSSGHPSFIMGISDAAPLSKASYATKRGWSNQPTKRGRNTSAGKTWKQNVYSIVAWNSSFTKSDQPPI
jgi:hypothetical protein